MKEWRKTFPARFEYLKNDKILLHDIEKDIPKINYDEEEEDSSFEDENEMMNSVMRASRE
jgi:hypothetical protein